MTSCDIMCTHGNVIWQLKSYIIPLFLVFQDLLTLEEQEGAVNFKFGLLYAKAGQKTDDEMFSNGKRVL